MILIDLPGTKHCFIINDISDSQAIESEIMKTFFPYARSIDGNDIPLEYDFWIETNGQSIAVKKEHGALQKIPGLDCGLPQEMYKITISIIRDHVQLDDDYCYLHGAAAIISGHLCLFLSETGTGKSTLGVYLDSLGHLCMTDDLIILNKRTNTLFPISQYAHIREGSVSLLSDQHTIFTYNPFLDRYEYELSAQRFEKAYKVEHIFTLHRREGPSAMLVSNSATSGILDNMFLPYQVKNNILSAIQLGNHFPIHELYYHHLSEVLDQMIAFVCAN